MPLRHYLIVFFFLALITSCSDDSASTSNGSGRLSLDVSIDASLTDPLSGTLVSVQPFVPDMSEIRLSMVSRDGAYSHTWTSLSDFPENQYYFPGTYQLEASFGKGSEGFDAPCYLATSAARVNSDNQTVCPLQLRMASSVFSVSSDLDAADDLGELSVIFHTPGRDYHAFEADESRLLYLTPGKTDVYIAISLSDGRECRFMALSLNSSAAEFYDVVVSVDNSGAIPVIECAAASEKATFSLTPDFLSANPPLIANIGWDLDASLILPEGEQPVENVKASVTTASGLSHLYLSTSSASLSEFAFPAQIDLLNLTDDVASKLESLGLTWSQTASGAEVDFTALLGRLVFLTDDEALTSFSLLAEDSQGRISNPLLLRVLTTPVDISIASVAIAPVGALSAELNVNSTASAFASNVAIEILGSDGQWEPAEVITVNRVNDDSYTLTFAIPDSNADIKARILYCEEVRAEFTVGRSMPSFSLDIDPFATYAIVRVKATDRAEVANIVSKLMLYIDGSRAAVLLRDEENGVLAVSGLTPSHTYSLTSTMMDRPDAADFTPEQRFTTESAPSLPNGDFEDRKDGVSYSRLPSGGRYSQTIVAIFNWQNEESFSQDVPVKWANTNSKTFCTRAANHNTWYMQPSVFTVRDDVQSGEFAVCLRSVGFDLAGEQIPDYTQTGEPYLKYSPVVPHVAWRAAGKIFLGNYSFSASGMEETYTDVVSWDSRPRSLNGFYKYNPSPDRPSDAGVALIEVYGEIDGERQVIASAKTYLPVANSYTAFTAQLDYMKFGVKATGLKVMFASSATVGTIAEETASVVTTPDPVKGASVGSTLWLDNVSLAY